MVFVDEYSVVVLLVGLGLEVCYWCWLVVLWGSVWLVIGICSVVFVLLSELGLVMVWVDVDDFLVELWVFYLYVCEVVMLWVY